VAGGQHPAPLQSRHDLPWGAEMASVATGFAAFGPASSAPRKAMDE